MVTVAESRILIKSVMVCGSEGVLFARQESMDPHYDKDSRDDVSERCKLLGRNQHHVSNEQAAVKKHRVYPLAQTYGVWWFRHVLMKDVDSVLWKALEL